MSAQMPDKFHYNDKEYYLESIEIPENFKLKAVPGGLVDIEQFGLHPIADSSACWRGYILSFAISDNKLVLDKIHTNNGNRKDSKIPIINGKKPKITKRQGAVKEYQHYREIDYEDIKLKMDYTGSLIIDRDFIEAYVIPADLGAKSPYFFNTVIRLTFNNGELVESKDLSEFAKSIRENAADYMTIFSREDTQKLYEIERIDKNLSRR